MGRPKHCVHGLLRLALSTSQPPKNYITPMFPETPRTPCNRKPYIVSPTVTCPMTSRHSKQSRYADIPKYWRLNISETVRDTCLVLMDYLQDADPMVT